MPQYLLSVRINEDEGESIDPSDLEQIYQDVEAVNQEIRAAGAWVFGGGLHPSSTATVVKHENGETITTDGPYVEAKEQVGGFWIIEAADLDEALTWAKKATVACQDPVEVRPFQDE